MVCLLAVWDKYASELFHDICREAADNLFFPQSSLPSFFSSTVAYSDFSKSLYNIVTYISRYFLSHPSHLHFFLDT